MKIVNNTIGITLFIIPSMLGSCHAVDPRNRTKDHASQDVNFVALKDTHRLYDDYTSSVLQCDGIVYNLEMVADQTDTTCYWDKHANNIVRLSTVYEAADTFFCGQDSYIKAATYCRMKPSCNYITCRTSIQVLNAAKVFEETWFISEEAYRDTMNGIVTYGFFDATISVEDGFIYHKGDVMACIRIIYTLKGFDGGFKKYILSFIKNKNRAWQLASRERINTMRQDPGHDPLGYCIDTSRYWGDFSETQTSLRISNEMLFRFGDTKCY